MPETVTMHIDPSKSKIAVQSDYLDIRGKPTYEWELWRDSGRVVKTSRAADGSETHITEKEIDPKSLSSEEILKPMKLNDLDKELKDITSGDSDTISLDNEFDLE